MSSQQSYVSKFNRFKDGVTLVSGWVDYNPTNNNKIKLPSLNTFVADVETAMTAVAADEEDMGNKQTARALLCFTLPENVNPTCFEKRVEGIRNYIEAEELSAAAVKILDRILRKIRPNYKKKAEGENKRPSPSEKTFAACVGQGREVIELITGLGAAYSPPDANLTVASMTTLVNNIENANKDVIKAKEKYGKSNRARKAYFINKTDGMQVRKTAMLKYSASFEGQKKSEHYIELRDAFKGV
jgi:hypothetical protein